jgi:DNA-binding CsgD family transcriptional regulator
MRLGVLLVNVASLSTSLAALIALAVLFVQLRSRGVLLLLGALLCLAADYVLGLSLYVPQDSPLWQGLSGFAAAGEWAFLAFVLKGICHVGLLLMAPAATLLLLGSVPSRAAVWAGGAAALLVLALLGGFAAGVLPRDPAALFAVSAAPAYASYAACLVILLLRRGVVQPGLPRGMVRAAIAALAVFVPALVFADIAGISGLWPALPVDPLAFVALTVGILVCSLLVLVRGARRAPAVDVDSFCAEHDLSVREREVLLLLRDGLRYKQIAERLCISLDTVKTHVSRIYRKTSAAGRTDLFYRIRLGGP